MTVAEGVVTLFGEVGSFPEEVAAGEAVLRVNGVRALAQDVQVRTAWSDITDGGIVNAAEHAREQAVDVPGTVDLLVDNRVVTLSGEVHWQFQRVAAERAVSYLKGVQGDIDRTTLDDVPTSGDVADRIHRALVRTAGAVARTVTVGIDQAGVVQLDGHVGSTCDQRTAEQA